jgi:hypothetical protein
MDTLRKGDNDDGDDDDNNNNTNYFRNTILKEEIESKCLLCK